MGEWSGQGIWWAMDFSIVLSMFYSSYSYDRGSRSQVENVLNPVAPTIDSLVSSLTWVLDKEPEQAFVVLDSGNSVRKQIYEPYKAFRSRPPEYHAAYEGALKDLRDNFLDAVRVVCADGWEADDVMATIAKQAVASGKKCVLMSWDKDVKQCLRRGHVNMQVRSKDGDGLPTWGFLTADEAEISCGGIRVDQFVDYQILLGDDVDNVPGASGIGEVTAVKLLKKYESIENMKKEEIPGKNGQALKEFWNQEPIIRQLITLNDSVDFKDVLL